MATSKTTASDIPCSSCRKHRYQLRARKSKLIPNVTLYLCNDCVAKKFEPRWTVIMAGREFGIEVVKDYLKPQRYLGEEIKLSELLK